MITYLVGDATYPQGEGLKIIPHVSNDRGGWGAGFVLALSKRWEEPERVYRKGFRDGALKLGLVQFVGVEPNLIVANMVAQRGYGKGNQSQHRSDDPDEDIPLSYEHLEICLRSVARNATGASVHMARIGCGLGGGKWEKVEPIIRRTLAETPVFVYDLP